MNSSTLSKSIRITDTHYYFWSGPLSNFYSCVFTMDNITFRSSEQAFMYVKALVFNDMNAAHNILQATTPKEAKALGRLVKNFNPEVWNEARLDIMQNVLTYKFSNSIFKSLLLNTGSRFIVEASPIDRIWGVGLSADNDLILDESNWKGQNLLGITLMNVREQLNGH